MGATRRAKVRRRAPIEVRAEHQDGLLGPDELRWIGRGAQHHRCRAGRWVRMRRRVVRVAGAPTSWRQSARAAVLAAGDRSFVSHASAARLYGIEDFDREDALEISAPLDRRIRLPSVTAHRCGTLEDGDIRRMHGMPVSSPIRLVLDLSGRTPVPALGRLVDELMRRRLLDIEKLRDRVDRTRPAPGRSVRKLRAVLARRLPGYDPGDSPLETRIVQVIREHGFPAPEQQFRIGRYRLDFAYPAARVFLEGNGFGFHSMASDLDRDAVRQNTLVGLGWRPLTFTWRMSDAQIVAALDAVFDRTAGDWRTPAPPVWSPAHAVRAGATKRWVRSGAWARR